MQITTKNYKTILAVDLIKLARKNIVREIDETAKGQYMAYVDEDENKTFDVSLTINEAGEITHSQCDCKNKTNFCRHKTALVLRITEAEKKTKKLAKTSQKNVLSFSLLNEVPIAELQDWLKKVFANNAAFEMAFIHHFSEKNKSYTPKEIEQVTLDAVKAVVKNKKLIDLTELKKIIELWTDIHAPILNQYTNNVADETLFENVHALFHSCTQVYYSLNISNKKIPAYIEGLLKNCLPALLSISDDSKFSIANSFFINKLVDIFGVIQYPYLQHLLNAIDQSSAERRLKLIDQLLTKYRGKRTEMRNDSRCTQGLFDAILRHELGHKYYKVFKPVMWQNNYNIKLIELLIINKEYDLSEKYAKDQIASNAREEYNIPYYELLKKIYACTNNEVGRASVLAELLPLTFSFDDYLFVSSHIKDAEKKKKWRSKLLSRASNSSRGNSNAHLFCFKLAEHEKQYGKMIGYIKEQTPYSLILEFLSPMLLTSKDDLLKALLNKNESWDWESDTDTDKELDAEDNIPIIYQELEKAFSRAHLKQVVQWQKSRWTYSYNKLMKYIEGVPDIV